MTLKMEIGEALDESFRAALVLTGSIERAECALTDVINALGSDLSRNALLVETARSVIQHTAFSESSSILPMELQALSLLSSTRRYCFVLRVLMGLDLETCSDILRSGEEVEEALYQSLLDLPRADESISAQEE